MVNTKLMCLMRIKSWQRSGLIHYIVWPVWDYQNVFFFISCTVSVFLFICQFKPTQPYSFHISSRMSPGELPCTSGHPHQILSSVLENNHIDGGRVSSICVILMQKQGINKISSEKLDKYSLGMNLKNTISKSWRSLLRGIRERAEVLQMNCER